MTHTRARRRGIGGLVIVLVTLACVLVGGMSGIVAADGGPVFDSVTLSTSVVARGDTVTVAAHITDTKGDVLDAPTISFLLPDNADGPSIDFILVSDTAHDGRYEAAVLISPLLPTGRYVVKQLRAYDSDGNVTMITPPDPRATGLTLTVVDHPTAASSTAPPTATATTAPQSTATATAVATTANTATATARPRATNTPAPSTATASRPTPTSMRAPVPTNGPGPDVPPTSTPTATVNARVTIVPTLNATATPTARAAATPTATSRPTGATATATGVPAATRPPAPPSAAASPTGTPAPFVSTVPNAVPVVVTLAVSSMAVVPGDALIVTARISDIAADVQDFPTLRYRMPDGSDGPFAYLRRVDGTVRDGIYQAVIGLSPFTPMGAYTIKELTVTDLAGNSAVYVAPVPPQPGVTFAVEPFVPFPTAPPADAG